MKGDNSNPQNNKAEYMYSLTRSTMSTTPKSMAKNKDDLNNNRYKLIQTRTFNIIVTSYMTLF